MLYEVITLDPLANPDLFLGQLLVESLPLLVFGVQVLRLVEQEGFVVAGKIVKTTAIDFDNAVGEAAEKRAVV